MQRRSALFASPNMTTDPFDILRISLLPKIGPTRGRALLSRFGSFEVIRRASRKELASVEGINDGLADVLIQFHKDTAALHQMDESVERSRNFCKDLAIHFLPYNHPDYPIALKSIYDPPLFVFVNGALPAREERLVAIVGTRMPTEYGKQAARKLVHGLSEYGVTIVSGLALGIDSIAHATALEYGMKTIAVLGSGLGVVYPYSNKTLAERIAETGCIISEFPVDAKPDAPNFPRRNRIISGLSLATVVVESGRRGGAIITAELALDQNKEVFAVPGSIFSPKSEGTNYLIRKGYAHSCTSVEDLIDELPLLQKDYKTRHHSSAQLTIAEQAILNVLGNDPLHIDDLAIQLGLQTSELLVQLLQMEFKNLVKQLPGKYFIRDE
jgi:DNA processing protein